MASAIYSSTTATNTASTWYSGTSPVVLSDGSGCSIAWSVSGATGSSALGKIQAYNLDTNKTYTWADVEEAWYEGMANSAAMRQILESGKTYMLPDKSKIVIDKDGNYTVEDKDSKVTYKANRLREFSPHLNASDMLAKFVEYVGGLGVKQSEVLKLPLELFINWLIIEAAERDHDPIPVEVVPVPRHPALLAAKKPKCLACGRFVPARHYKHKFQFCDPGHAVRYLERNRDVVQSRVSQQRSQRLGLLPPPHPGALPALT